MPVTRCVCHDVTFAELKDLAQQVGSDLDTLSKRTGCGTGCGTCVPYIQLMLNTGRTEFPVLTGAQFAALLNTQPAPRAQAARLT
ncbi:MAG: (2Fe-2S)-binding protein [Phycisphaeraceae bacterium]|nr:(2Fe-2S)-binding protein [Phycisphaeraceae bacterium]